MVLSFVENNFPYQFYRRKDLVLSARIETLFDEANKKKA